MVNGRSEVRTFERHQSIPNPYDVMSPREYELGAGRPPVYMPTTPVRRSGGGTLYDVVELILDRGLVIDAFVRVSLVGIELLTIDARVVIAGVDTYLRFAEAANRLDLRPSQDAMGIPQLFGADSKARIGRAAADTVEGGERAIDDAGEAVGRGFRRAKEAVTGHHDDRDDGRDRRRGADWR
jgi:gas vesicle structural protein